MTCLGAILVTLYHFDLLKLGEKLTKYMKVYWWLWNQSLVLSWIVSIFYWMYHNFSHEEVDPIDLNNILTHVTNSVVLTFDLFIVRHPPNYANLGHNVAVVVVYAVFTFIFQIGGGRNT